MKLLFFITAFMFLFSKPASAQEWWSVRADLSSSKAHMQAVVFNPWNRSIVCRGFAYASFYYGSQAKSWMNNAVIPPRTYGYVYITAFNAYHDPIVNAWADIECRWE